MTYHKSNGGLSLLGRFPKDGGDALVRSMSKRCIDFGGTNEYLRADDAIDPLATSQAWTIACWFRRDGAIVTPARALWAINNGSGGSPDNRATIFFDAGATAFSRYQDETGTVAGTRHATTTVTDGEWHLMLVTQTAAGALEIYVDDVREFSATVTATIAVGDILMIGAELDPGFVPGNYWPGDIHSFAVWDGAVDPAVYAPALYRAGPSLNLRHWLTPAPMRWYMLGSLPFESGVPDLMLSGTEATYNNVVVTDVVESGA